MRVRGGGESADVAGDAPDERRPERQAQDQHREAAPQPWLEIEEHARPVEAVRPDQQQFVARRLAKRPGHRQMHARPIAVAVFAAQQKHRAAGGRRLAFA